MSDTENYNQQTDLTKTERVVFTILSLLLFTGAVALHVRHSRSWHGITIVKGGVREQLTLKEVEERLGESRRIDINTSTAGEITAIPGIGRILAERIVKYRDTHGGFKKVDDLLSVEGIGEITLKKIQNYTKKIER